MLGTKNRFAALKIDDDEDENAVKKTSAANQNQSNSAAKKKNKKKKEDSEALRSMAFGTGRPSSKQQKSGSGGQSKSGTATVDDWEEWQRRDNQSTDDMYRDDMEKALLMSRLEEEQRKMTHKQAGTERGPSAASSQGSAAGGKKKKKKDKPQAMSLDQFKQLPPETLPGSDDEVESPPSPPSVQTRVPEASQDTQYFDNVASDADKILQKERIQEQYQRAYAHESAMQSKYQDDIEKMGKTITELESKLQERDAELKKVKMRNAKFCNIFKEAEMREKATIVLQNEQLTADKRLLTEQLESLNAELEKERSKSRALKLENDKLKGKHGK